MSKRPISVLFAFLLLFPTVYMFGFGAVAAEEQTILVVGVMGYPDSLNPFNAIMSSSFQVISLIYDMAINGYGPDNNPVPDLAESWEVSEDGKVWTLHIVKNATWHDGVPVTAEDVKFTIDYVIDYPYFRPDYQQSMVISYLSTVEKVECPDNYTVKVYFSEPLACFGQPFFFIVPKHIWEDVDPIAAQTNITCFEEDFPPIGSGPFIFEEAVRDQYIKLRANKDYFMGAPKYDYLIFKYYTDESTMIADFLAGKLDYIDLSPETYEQIKGQPNIVTYAYPSLSIMELGFNCWEDLTESKGHPALLDTRVRRAIAHAINKTELVEVALKGLGEVGQSILTPQHKIYYWEPSEDEVIEFNLSKANQILDEAGYLDVDNDGIRETPPYILVDLNDNGVIDLPDENITIPEDKRELKFSIWVDESDAEEIAMLPLIEEWLNEIGIKLKEKNIVDSDTMIDVNLSGEMDLYLWGWGWDIDPDFALSVFTTDQIGWWSDCFYSNPNYDELYEKQHVEVNITKRVEIVKEMQEILYYDCPYVVIAYPYDLTAHRTDRFKGWIDETEHPGASLDFEKWGYLALEPVEKPEGPAKMSLAWILGGTIVIVVIIAAVLFLKKRTPKTS